MPELELVRVRHHARAAAGGGRTASTTTSSTTPSSTAACRPASSSSTPSYSGRRYGTLRSELDQRLERGAPVVLEIEVQGARQVAETMPEAVRIFIAPPTEDALRTRLVGRGTDSPEDVEKRLATAREELRAQGEFAHVVVNDRLDDAVGALEEVVRTALGSGATNPTEEPS